MIAISKPAVGKEELRLITQVLSSGVLTQGQKRIELEKEFAKFCGTKHAVAVNSGTAALHTSLCACRIGYGDEVITTPFTFMATANVILMQKAKVVFADIRNDTFNIDPDEVQRKITKKTRAIIAVDLYGQPADYDRLRAIAKEHKLVLIEDACQAHGAEFKGEKTGKLGDIGCFSLYATKNMMCGEGGIITTDNPRYSQFCKIFRNQGMSEEVRYKYFRVGYNYRMTELEAALALAQLKKLDQLNRKRIQNARMLTKGLNKVKGITVPFIDKRAKHVFHQYTIKCDNLNIKRDGLLNYLRGKSIMATVYYPKPLHLYSHIRELGYKKGDFPVAEKIAKQVLSLPVHPSLKKVDIHRIVNAVRNYASRRS